MLYSESYLHTDEQLNATATPFIDVSHPLELKIEDISLSLSDPIHNLSKISVGVV